MYYGRSRGGAYGTALYKQVGMWVVIMFVFGFAVPGINNWGHAGGIGAGALLGYLLGYTERKRETPFHRLLATLCLAGTAGILVWAVVTGFYYRLL
jgi:rhomboid protease GluP